MGINSAVISRDMYAEASRYVMTVLQAGVPLVDADYNDQMVSFFTQLRRVVQSSLGDGAAGDAFKIVQNPIGLVNDFIIRGGTTLPSISLTVNADGSVVLPQPGPEQLFVKGHQAQLPADETYKAGVQTVPISVSFATAIFANDTLVDTAANYIPGSLVGKTLQPNLGNVATFIIIANSANTIQVGASMTAVASPGNRYRVYLTTPPAGPNRKDLVYLDVYLDEIDSVEDPNLLHTIDSINIEAMRRKKLIQTVLVREGVVLPLVIASGYNDADGNPHVLVPLAIIDRPGGNATIVDSMITDVRRKIFSLDAVSDQFVDVAGDTMTGPLVMQANIVLDPGRKVLGTCIIDGAALCPESVEQKHFKRTSHLLGRGNLTPTWNQVNNPADANHFLVHDNRYYTKDEIDNIIGVNLITNGLFDDCLDGWENGAPQPLYGYPPQEAANVVISCGLCGSPCGPVPCSCRTIQVHVPEFNRACYICVVRQEVCGGIRCGGDFLLIETVCVTKGNEAVRPFMILDLYSSCKYVGTKQIPMFTPPENDPLKPGLTIQDGFVRMEVPVSLAKCIDNVVMTLCFEIVPLSELPPLPIPETCDTCKQGVALDEGTGSLEFCIESLSGVDPWVSSRLFPIPVAVGNQIKMTVSTDAPGQTVSVVLFDSLGKKAYADRVLSGGQEELTVTTGTMVQPDGPVDFSQIAKWSIIWLNPVAGQHSNTDNWRGFTDAAPLLLEGWNDVVTSFTNLEVECGYAPDPISRSLVAPRSVAPRGPQEDLIIINGNGHDRTAPQQRALDRDILGHELATKCEVGAGDFDFAICGAQIRRISGAEGSGNALSACNLNTIPIIKRAFIDGRIEFTPAKNQVSTIIEVLEENCI
jgi:hypothetical protein